MDVISKDLVRSILPKREADANKYSVGSCVCIVGSRGFTGAGVLALRGALRSGAGFVHAVCPIGIYPILTASVPEVVFIPLAETCEGTVSGSGVSLLVNKIERSKCVLAGCGMSDCQDTEEFICGLVKDGYCNVPLVLDADGINVISRHIDILKGRNFPTILTPHEGEMSRLTGLSSGYIHENREKVAGDFARENGVIVVLKGKDTVIADENGKCFVNPTGNSGMAVAGSGDVLAGMISSFVSQGASPIEGAILGVYLHGLSGDICKEELTEYSLLPSDIINGIPKAIKEVLN